MFPAALLAVMLTAPVLSDESACANGVPVTATLGIGLFQCRGGSCAVNSHPFDKGAGRAHFFSVEPSVWQLDPDGPARDLNEGDVIAMVDGLLITSREGGRRLANLQEGVPVRLRVRREGHEMDVTLVPERGCNMPALTVTRPSAGGRPKGPPRASGGPLDFGMAVLCGDCGWRASRGRWVWYAREPMGVVDVTPGGPADRAGLRAGDRIVSLQGQSLGAGPDEHLGGLSPGEEVRVGYERVGRRLEATLVPRRATSF